MPRGVWYGRHPSRFRELVGACEDITAIGCKIPSVAAHQGLVLVFPDPPGPPPLAVPRSVRRRRPV